MAGAFFDIFLGDYEIEGMRFVIPRNLTTRQFRGRFLLNEYETDIERLYLHKYLAPSARVLELGGCLGVMSCIINKLLHDPTKHVVLEPHPGLVPLLVANRDRNSCSYTVRQGVVSTAPYETFYVHDLIVGGSTTRTTSRPLTVPGFTVERLAEAHGFAFDTLVLDIEGGEYDLFKALDQRIRQFHRIFLELHDRADFSNKAAIAMCPELLKSQGFELLAEDRRGATQQVWSQR